MTKELKKKYFEMQHKIILPADAGEKNTSLAATVSANFASIGFPLPNNLAEELSHASREDIIAFYKEYYGILKEVIGADRDYKTFYPGFPESCMSLTEADYFIDQVIYGLSGLEITPSDYMAAKERFPFIGTPMYHVMEKGSEEDFGKLVQQTIISPMAYSVAQTELIRIFVADAPDSFVLPDAKSLKNRENLVALACIIEDATGKTSHLGRYLTTPTDVLRYAAVKSAIRDYERGSGNIIELKDSIYGEKTRGKFQHADFYHYASLRFKDDEKPSFALSRADRKEVARLLDKTVRSGDMLAKQMYSNRDLWKQLVKNMHINEIQGREKVKEAFERFSKERSLDRYERRIEEAIKAGDLDAALKEAVTRPGDFARRFDKLYRMGIEQGREAHVLNAIKEVASKAGIATAMGLQGNLASRTKEESVRNFIIPKSNTVWSEKHKNRAPFTEMQVKMVEDTLYNALKERFAGKEDMGKVYISPNVKFVKVPVNVREQTSGIEAMTNGSVTPLPDKDIERFFVTWTNISDKRSYGNNVDIDLSVALLDKDGKTRDIVSWDESHVSEGFVFSGDEQDGGPVNGDGVAEYIDIDRKKMLESGIYYIVPRINSFSGQLFSEQPHTAFGVMFLNKDDMGKEFEPQAVMNRFVLNTPSRGYIPMAIDLEKNEMKWIGEQDLNRVASQDTRSAEIRMQMVNDSKALDIYQILLANVEANGTLTDIRDADTIFVGSKAGEMYSLRRQFPDIDFDKKNIIEMSDMAYVQGYLLQDGPKPEERETHVHDSQDWDLDER